MNIFGFYLSIYLSIYIYISIYLYTYIYQYIYIYMYKAHIEIDVNLSRKEARHVSNTGDMWVIFTKLAEM